MGRSVYGLRHSTDSRSIYAPREQPVVVTCAGIAYVVGACLNHSCIDKSTGEFVANMANPF